MGHQTSAKLKVHNMTASSTFTFGSAEITQAVIVNTASPSVTIRDENNNDFKIAENGKLSISSVNGINVSGISVITASGGTCDIIYH